ncbi:HEAT repeat domain-containing protein [Breznakiella homolactica]|uniref:HEAT repeat domain-containing protein n=1 Tax=Breznakiella homolactica TaxID=2798577 RepID=A0A7T7XP86_9SPIR|nr:hypothetical protein [Breznakiella homolactica]QQO09961.1 hypothetical protein JFL75_03340 [Breznakiella homolactica]
MAIPILNELNDEITRLYIAGSSLGRDDPRIKKYIPALQKLGEKAPVFNTLAERLIALTGGDGSATPEALMEAGMLLYSIRYTQGSTDTGETPGDMVYAAKPLTVARTPYSKLNELITLLTSGSQAHSDLVREIYESGLFRDPRLFAAYAAAVTDNRSFISNYIADVIIPAVGQDMVPFIEESLDIKGSKRHARLFRILYHLTGKAILPLAETALAEGASHVAVEAIHALGEDPKYEETLLSCTKDKKGDVKAAAFAALVKLGSARGDELILEGLGKANIGHLEEALAASKNPDVAAKVQEEAERILPAFKESHTRLAVLLRVLARRNEEAGLVLIEKLYADPKFYADAVYLLDLENLLGIIAEENTERKNRLLLAASEKNESLGYYKLVACIRLFSREEVFERCKDVMRSKGYSYNLLNRVYGLDWDSRIPDDRKPWDPRWAGFFVARGDSYLAYRYIYNNDVKTWKQLLEICAKQIKDRPNRRENYYADILSRAFANKHPEAMKYYEKFIKAGYAKEELMLTINTNNPGTIQ